MMVIIGNDPGGNIAAYAIYEQFLDRGGDSVRIVGSCDSSCTLFLALPPERLCAAAQARFGFHAGSTVAGTEFMFRQYPGWLKEWITINGGLTQHWLYLQGEELFSHVRRCE